MDYVDFVNGDAYDEMDELTEQLFGNDPKDEVDAFQDFREECLQLAEDKDKAVVEAFLEEVKFPYPIGYSNRRCDSVMEIYTNHPGILIGKGGATIRKFEEILTEEFDRPYHVKICEIRGGFANLKV